LRKSPLVNQDPMQAEERTRDLAVLNLAIDSKLHGMTRSGASEHEQAAPAA
jgi:hypothetical protein